MDHEQHSPQPKLRDVPLQKLMELPESKALIAEFKELVRLAKPLYIEMLCSLPFYEARRHDDRFWEAYIGSRIVEARELVRRRYGADPKSADSTVRAEKLTEVQARVREAPAEYRASLEQQRAEFLKRTK